MSQYKQQVKSFSRVGNSHMDITIHHVRLINQSFLLLIWKKKILLARCDLPVKNCIDREADRFVLPAIFHLE